MRIFWKKRVFSFFLVSCLLLSLGSHALAEELSVPRSSVEDVDVSEDKSEETLDTDSGEKIDNQEEIPAEDVSVDMNGSDDTGESLNSDIVSDAVGPDASSDVAPVEEPSDETGIEPLADTTTYRDYLTGTLPINSASMAKAQKVLDGMTLDEKVGQVFMSHMSPTQSMDISSLVDTYHPGSIILFKFDVEKYTPAALKSLLAGLQDRANQGIMFAVDEEGGKVCRVSNVSGYRAAGAFPGPQDLKVSGNPAQSMANVHADTKEKAELLLDLGFNMNLAPVADVAGPTGYIYARTYGGDGVENATYIDAVVSEARANGLGTCLKHFPGYGGTSSNTHEGFAQNDLTLEQFETNDLIPFAAGISAGTDMVLVTHNAIMCMDTVNPASLSPAVYGFMRNEMGFGGIAITDDLNMKAVTDFCGSNSPAVMALNAGADMVITPLIQTEWPKVKAAVSDGTLSMDKLDASVLRILYWKAEHHLLKIEENPEPSDIEAVYLDAGGAEGGRGLFVDMWKKAMVSGGTVQLLKDATFTEALNTNKQSITLDLHGCDLVYDGAAGTYGITVDGTFVLDDSVGGSIRTDQVLSDTALTASESSYADGVLLYGLKGDKTRTRIDFNDQTVGSFSGNHQKVSTFCMTGGSITIKNGIIKESAASGIYGTGGYVMMNGGAIVGCKSAARGGGGISLNGDVYHNAGYVAGNTSDAYGGGLYSAGYVCIYGGRIIGNTARDGGGAYAGGTLYIDGGSLVYGNQASETAGGLGYGAALNLRGNTEVIGNTARTGGGVYSKGVNNTVTGSPKVIGNTSNGVSNDGIYLSSDTTFLASGLSVGATLSVSSDQTTVMIPFIRAGDWGLTEAHLTNFSYAKGDYVAKLLDDGSVVFEKTSPVLPDGEASFVRGGVEVNRGTFTEMWDKAIAGGGGLVRLNRDVDLNTSVSTGTNALIVDLHGHVLRNTGGAGSDLFWVNTGGSLHVTDTVGTLSETSTPYSGRMHQYSYKDGVLVFGVKGSTSYKTLNLNKSTVGKIQCSGSNRAVVVNGGDFYLDNGIISNGKDGVITYSTKDGATGGSFQMTGGVVMDNASTWNGGVVNFSTGSETSRVILTGGYLLNNSAVNNGGAIFTNGAILAYGDTAVIGNTAKNGGGLYSNGKTTRVYGDALLGWNTATNQCGAMNQGERVSIHERATIVCNRATTGGVTVISGTWNYISGSIRVFDNTATTGSDLYLTASSGFRMVSEVGSVNGLQDGAQVVVSHASMPSANSMQVVWHNGNVTWDERMLERIIPADTSYVSERKDTNTNDIYFTKAEQYELPCGLYLDANPYVFDGVVRYSENAHSITFTRMVSLLGKYGFDELHAEDYDGTHFGFLDAGGNVSVYNGSVQVYDGSDYILRLDTMDDLKDRRFVYLSKPLAAGTYTEAEISRNYGFWTIDVHDVYATVFEGSDTGNAGDTKLIYAADGSTVTLSLTNYGPAWPWRDVRKTGSDYEAMFTEDGNIVNVVISAIHSSVVITNGKSDDVMYNVQYYAYIDRLDLSDVGGSNKLEVIDTTGGKLPENVGTLDSRFLTLDAANGNRVLRNRKLHSMYEDKSYVYSLNPSIGQIDRMHADTGYELSEIWVLPPGGNSQSTDRDDFTVYNLDDFPDMESLHDLHLTIDSTNLSEDTILISSGTTLRFVYGPVVSEKDKEVTFYDYDISDGQVYSSEDYRTSNGPNSVDPAVLTAYPTTSQGDFRTVYLDTYQKGINHPDNYTGTGTRLGFGNANTNMGWANETWNGIKINQYNRNPAVYKGCAFGLVDGFAGDELTGYYPIYAPGISAPYLFRDGVVHGKTKYQGMMLTYEKSGDSYTLKGVKDTDVQGLDQFNHPKTGNTVYSIWTNNFWPADSFPSFGGNGHDAKWGDYTKNAARRFFSGNIAENPGVTGTQAFANSDDGLDHNGYFGMSFSINFSLPEGYVGPLDYAFFGDDDMWVFLDDQLIIDIGGIHSSVGEYANLWDYLDPERDGGTDHKLTFFYTERGASGSTCWMTFNLPQVKFGTETRMENEGSIELTKSAKNAEDPEQYYEFDVEFYDEEGNTPKDDFTFTRLDPQGNIIGYGLIENGKGHFSIRSGGKLIVPYVRNGIQYKISEKRYNCVTRFKSVLQESETNTDSSTVRGTVQEGETVYIVCENLFSLWPFMPSTGSSGLLNLLQFGSWSLAFAIPVFGVLWGWKRKRQYW